MLWPQQHSERLRRVGLYLVDHAFAVSRIRELCIFNALKCVADKFVLIEDDDRGLDFKFISLTVQKCLLKCNFLFVSLRFKFHRLTLP